jgi:hypothetical protein
LEDEIMKRYVVTILALAAAALLVVAIVTALDEGSRRDERQWPDLPPDAPPDDEEMMRMHEQITGEGILAEFVEAVSADRHQDALDMLHPRLAEEWGREQFIRDWRDVREQLFETWQPEPTGSFSGTSLQGPYTQATYRLESDWTSIFSVSLTSMEVDGQPRVVNVQIVTPGSGEPSPQVQAQIDDFVRAAIAQDFDSVKQMLAPQVRAQYPAMFLQQVSGVLGDSADATSREHYRMCANGKWLQAVRLARKDDAASFVETFTSTDGEVAQIEGLSLKARVSE